MCNFYMMYWVKGKEPLGTLHFHFSILSFIIENPCIKVQNAIFFFILDQKNCFSPGPPFWSWKRNAFLQNIPDEEASTLP